MRFPMTAALSAALLLAACGHSPATAFLVLDPIPPATPPIGYAGPPLRVPFVHLPVTLDRPELVHRDGVGTVKVQDFARWSAPLGIMARNTLIQNLTQRLPVGSVLPPDAIAVAGETRLEVTVLSFEAQGGTAAMTVSYRLVTGRAADVRPDLVQLSTPLMDDTSASRAGAWSRLLGQFSDRVVAHLSSLR